MTDTTTALPPVVDRDTWTAQVNDLRMSAVGNGELRQGKSRGCVSRRTTRRGRPSCLGETAGNSGAHAAGRPGSTVLGVSDLATWTIDVPPPSVEPSPRWVRVRAGEIQVANSRRALLLAWYGPGMLPTYCLPAEDVTTDLLRPSATPAAHEFVRNYDVCIGTLIVPRSAQLFRKPPAPLQALDEHWTFTWDDGLSWFEEALEVHVHARDPSKRVDVVPSERHVRVEINGEVVAESRRPHALFETTLPTRWYLPIEDIRPGLLEPSSTVSRCPYKGTASYWSIRIGEVVHPDVAWTYRKPVIEWPRIAGLVCFFNEKVNLIIDGVSKERPRTPWSS